MNEDMWEKPRWPVLCFIGLHRWRWFSLRDATEPDRGLHASQCQNCGRIVGGWQGRTNT